jgi:hypothetical protein
MNESKEKAIEAKDAEPKDKKVHVTVLYTATAKDKKFNAALDSVFKGVVGEAYDKLGETPRNGDQLFCHEEPRHDMSGYFGMTLEEMLKKNICVREVHGKLELEFDVDSDIGGAAE